jgi:hypothetical protein
MPPPSIAHAVVADVVASVELEVAFAGIAQIHDDARRLAVDHAGDPGVVRVDHGPRVGAGPDVVARVVGVDHVAAVARADDRRLPRLVAGLVVAPDNVARAAADDGIAYIGMSPSYPTRTASSLLTLKPFPFPTPATTVQVIPLSAEVQRMPL